MGLTLSHKPLNLPDTLAVFTACRGRYAQARTQTWDRLRYVAGDATGTRPCQGHPAIGMAVQVGGHRGMLTQQAEMETCILYLCTRCT